MNTMNAIFSRRSIRSFNGKAPENDLLEAIIKAANASPVGLGRYEDMHLTLVTSPELLARINAVGAKMFGRPDANVLYGAPVLVIVSTKRLAIEKMANVAYSNAAGIVENMALAAVELSVGACHIWGATAALSSDKELCADLGIPDDLVPCCALALGMSDEPYSEREVPANRISLNRVQ